MKNTKSVLIFISAIMGLVLPPLSAQQGPVRQVKLVDFELQSSALVSSAGEEISSPDYASKVYWFPVKVPSTVLNALVNNKVYPDPYQGMNNMLIPDASDEFNKQYNLERFSHLPNNPNPWKKPYWYRTTFNVPSTDAGKRFQLIFKGINYRAAVWVNGEQVADSAQMAGMFAQYSLDVSKQIKAGKVNGLAVKIYPVDYPGLPATEQLEAFGDFYANGGPTGDIGKNVTMLCSVGWDWVPPVRDRNMGIWLPVYLRTSGAVTISEPKVVTTLPNLPDTSLANLSVSLKLSNTSSNTGSGKLNITISPENFTGTPVKVTRNVMINANAQTEITLNQSLIREFAFSDPKLWWPNGYGRPNLYRIRLQYADNSGVSDDTSFVFGFRSVASSSKIVNGSWRRDFYVNGERIQITGGAWVPDFMLNRDSLRYDREMALCRNSNINLVRIWGGGVTPCDEFWDAADRYGMLVWSDFWVTGDTQGEFKGSPDWPLEGNIFTRNVINTILRIRNHPSLLVWTGGNEGHARKELYNVMRNSIITLDGTRPYIPSSSGFAALPQGWDGAWPDNNPTGAYSGGPYTWQDPKKSYERAISAKDWVFKDETGLPSMTPYNILPKIIPNLVWDKTLPFPLNHSWGYHDAATGNGKWDEYYYETLKRYGDPSSMEDFCNKTQLMNATGYQGIFEAAGHKLNDIGGIMLWKLNAAFPSVVWQVYDWYLMPNAGYYFMQNALEPVHIQLNLKTNSVMVLNRTFKPVAGLTADAEIFNLNSRSLFRESKSVSLNASDVKDVLSLSNLSETEPGVKFVVLNLKDSGGKVVSHNVYWLSENDDYKALNDMKKTSVRSSVSPALKGKTETSWKVVISNPGQTIAFFIRPQLMAGGEEILPSYWSANYFTLAPGEKMSITVCCPNDILIGKKTSVKVSGWNVEAVESDAK